MFQDDPPCISTGDYINLKLKIGQVLVQIRVVANVVPKDMFIKKICFFLMILRAPAPGLKFEKRPFFCDYNEFSKTEQGPYTSINLHIFLPL